MGTSDNADTQPTFADQVNNVVSQATVDDKGNLQLPDGVEVSDEVLYAAKLEKRARDTQSAYTKAQQRTKQLETEVDKLASSWQQDAVRNLSDNEKAELEELKSQDPEAWRTKINELEAAKVTQFQEKRQGIAKEASQMTELELREQQLEEFNKANPEFAVTDELIENDIPPRITKKLEQGEISFAEFLEQCKDYVQKPKVIQKVEAENNPGFASAPGSGNPTPEAVEAQSSNDYNQEIF